MKGLYSNIHEKRERIKQGSGERMRKPGSISEEAFEKAKKTAKKPKKKAKKSVSY